jgi:hypothetical protein
MLSVKDIVNKKEIFWEQKKRIPLVEIKSAVN